jgi:hypothetical protein
MNKEIIKEQIIKIQRSGMVNMLFVDDIKAIAQRFRMTELVDYLNQPNNNYIDFIMVGGEL